MESIIVTRKAQRLKAAEKKTDEPIRNKSKEKRNLKGPREAS